MKKNVERILFVCLFVCFVFRAITLGLSKLYPPQFQNLNFVQLFHTVYYHCYSSASVHCTHMNTEWLHDMFSCFWTMPGGVHMVRSFHVHKFRGCEECLVKKQENKNCIFFSELFTEQCCRIWQNYIVDVIKAHTVDSSFSLRRAM